MYLYSTIILYDDDMIVTQFTGDEQFIILGNGLASLGRLSLTRKQLFM